MQHLTTTLHVPCFSSLFSLQICVGYCHNLGAAYAGVEFASQVWYSAKSPHLLVNPDNIAFRDCCDIAQLVAQVKIALQRK